jgi:hypothetical protein
MRAALMEEGLINTYQALHNNPRDSKMIRLAEREHMSDIKKGR